MIQSYNLWQKQAFSRFFFILTFPPFLSFLAVFSFGNDLLRQNPRPNKTNPSAASMNSRALSLKTRNSDKMKTREMEISKWVNQAFLRFFVFSFLAVFSFGNGLLRQNPRPNETNPSTASEFRRRQGNGKRIQHLHAEGLWHLWPREERWGELS